MKSLTEHLWFEVPERRGYINITGTVEELVRKSGVREGRERNDQRPKTKCQGMTNDKASPVPEL